MNAIFTILARILQIGGTVAGGWAISDWFNETKRAEQLGTEKPQIKTWFSGILKPFLFILAVAGVVIYVFNQFFTKKR